MDRQQIYVVSGGSGETALRMVQAALTQFSTRSVASLARCDQLLDGAFMIGCHPVLKPAALETLHRALESLSTL